MNSILSKIEELSKELNALKPIKEEYKIKLDKKFRLELNYNSNHIEGNTLTYGETELLLIFDETKGNHTLREYEEVKGHDIALKLIEEWAADKEHPLTEAYIKNLNEVILREPFWKEAITPDGQNTRRLIKIGNYKEFPNSVRLQNGELFHYASLQETPILMGELINWYRNEEAILHPVTLAAMLHYKFVCIHPFDDGNGRIARLLMNYVLLKNNLPPIIIKSKDKQNYLQVLHLADVGDYEPFINYTAEQVIWSLEISLKAGKGEEIDEEEDIDKKISLLERELENIDSEEEVKVHFNKEVFFNILNTSIKELILKIIPVVQKFNKFFSNISHQIHVQQGIAYVQFSNEEPMDVFNKLIENYKSSGERFQEHNVEFTFYTFYGSFKKGGLKTFGCNYGFQIKFDTIKYEMFIDEFDQKQNKRNNKKIFERLLHKPITKKEIDFIVNELANSIYNHIDLNSKNQGLI